MRERDSSRELVVLLHGLAAPRLVMRPLQQALAQRGFATLNWGYPSILREIEPLSRALSEQLQRIEAESQVDRFHLVTHSMGSILARAALQAGDFPRLGRIVMLAPPHRGSRVATNLSHLLRFCKPLRQLSHRPDSLVNSLAEPTGHDIGIIAAARDRVVHVDSTQLSTQADHIVVRGGHTSMLFRREVACLVESFLRSGRFTESATETSSG